MFHSKRERPKVRPNLPAPIPTQPPLWQVAKDWFASERAVVAAESVKASCSVWFTLTLECDKSNATAADAALYKLLAALTAFDCTAQSCTTFALAGIT